MIWQVLVAWEEPTTLYLPWNSPTSALTLHNCKARRFAFSETASNSCRHLAEQDCYPSVFYHCSSEKTITWKARKLKKKKNQWMYLSPLGALIVETNSPEIRRRDSFNTGRGCFTPPAHLNWMLEIFGNNESDLAFWNRLRHLITGFIFFPLTAT